MFTLIDLLLFSFQLILVLYKVYLLEYLVDGSAFEFVSEFLLFRPEGDSVRAIRKEF